jgi:hypothetical protein
MQFETRAGPTNYSGISIIESQGGGVIVNFITPEGVLLHEARAIVASISTAR